MHVSAHVLGHAFASRTHLFAGDLENATQLVSPNRAVLVCVCCASRLWNHCFDSGLFQLSLFLRVWLDVQSMVLIFAVTTFLGVESHHRRFDGCIESSGLLHATACARDY